MLRTKWKSTMRQAALEGDLTILLKKLRIAPVRHASSSSDPSPRLTLHHNQPVSQIRWVRRQPSCLPLFWRKLLHKPQQIQDFPPRHQRPLTGNSLHTLSCPPSNPPPCSNPPTSPSLAPASQVAALQSTCLSLPKKAPSAYLKPARSAAAPVVEMEAA